jgi:two-component system response regulator RegA
MPIPKFAPAVLVIDDDEVYRTRLCRAFIQRGWEAYGASGAAQALEMAREASPDLALVDLRMPGDSGLELIPHLRGLDATIAIVVLTGYGSIPTALEAIRLGADHYLSKPADADQILAVYERIAHPDAGAEGPPESVPTLARVEWEHIQRVLADCSGNITQAARLLGIHRRSLQRKLSKYPPSR